MTTNEQTQTEKIRYTCLLNPSNNDTVSSAAWTITPPTGTLAAQINTSLTSSMLISGLTAPTVYIVNVHFVGTSGQEYDGYLEINAVVQHTN